MTPGDDTHDDDIDRDGSETGAGAVGNSGAMGQALRGVYQKTVEEAIPDEMLDLLGKLD